MIQLADLLTSSSDNEIAAECLERIRRDEDVRYRDDYLIPLTQVIDIYSVRARINADRGGKVEGYELLLPALEAAPVLSVRLHSLEFFTHWFVAFTDESSTRLFGILKSPKQKGAWYVPGEGYDG